MFVFQFVGASRSVGKTATIVRLIEIFRERGLKVGVVKHGHDYDPSFDLKSVEDAKDTVRFTKAGSEVTVAVTDYLTVTITGVKNLDRIIEEISNHVDIVFLEGFKHEERYTRIVVANSIDEVARLLTVNTLAVTGNAATINYDKLRSMYPSLIIARNVEELAGAIYSSMVEKIVSIIGGKSCGACGYPNCEAFAEALRRGEARLTACLQISSRVSVYLDGCLLKLNPFVQLIIEKTIRGMLSALKGVGKQRRIEIFISSSE